MTQLLDRKSIIESLKSLPKEDVLAIQNSVKEQIKASRKPRVKKRKYVCDITGTIITADDDPALTFYVQKEGTTNANKLSMAAMIPGNFITRPRKAKKSDNGNSAGDENDLIPLTEANADIAHLDSVDDDLEDVDDDLEDVDDDVDDDE
jgi:hypothetical protein